MARGNVDIAERRLRPIYDALDNGNNKKALQEADKALKKQRDLICAKALRGLALLRLGRGTDCEAQLKEVHDACPTDDSTLQAMSISYREMQRMDKIAELYENGHQKDPQNEEILSALFMAYVRMHNYKKQQQTAMKLHKLKPEKNPYYFWNVMSLVMQAQEADERLANTMFFPLAERMCEKYAGEGRLEAEAEVNLYLLVLDLLKKHESALTLLQGPLADKLHSEPDYVEMKAADLLIKLEKWPEANRAYRKLLIKMPDQWQFYIQYFASVFQLLDSSWNPEDALTGNSEIPAVDQSKSENPKESSDSTEKEVTKTESNDEVKENGFTKDDGIDYTVEMVVSFLNSQVDALVVKEDDETPPPRPLRGPYLAKLELLKQLQKRDKADVVDGLKMDSAYDLLVQYYKLFGDKTCCYGDIKPYLALLKKDQQRKLLQGFAEDLQLNVNGDVIYPTDKKVMCRHLTIQKLTRHAGFHENTSTEEKMTLVTELYRRHQDGLRFGTDLIETDLQYSDDYMLLAAHLLHDAHAQTGDQQYLWQACVMLEKALSTSAVNFQFKLLLIKLYCLLGAFGPCPTLYDSMEIKHIQNDSMGYTVTNHIARLGHISSAASLYETMLRFFSMNQKETTEYLVQSYKYGSFAKIIEFVKFRERLKNSFQYAAAKTERMLLDLTMETVNHESTEQVVIFMDIRPRDPGMGDIEVMTDNRDWRVMSTWHPPEKCTNQELMTQSMKEELAWLKLRNRTLRVLGAGVICAQTTVTSLLISGVTGLMASQNGGDEEEGSEVAEVRQMLLDLTAEFTKALEETKAFVKSPTYTLCGPYRTRVCTYLHLGLGDILTYINAILLDVHLVLQKRAEKLESSAKENAVKFKESFSGLVAKYSKDVITESDDTKNKCFNPELLENLVLITELIGHVCIVLGTCFRLTQSCKPLPARGKGAKKKQQKRLFCNSIVDELTTLCTSLRVCVSEQAAIVTDVFKRVDSTVLQMGLQSLTINPVPGQSGDSKDEDLSKFHDSVKSKVLESYQISAREMLTFLHNKTEYLNSLVLH